MQHGTPTLAAEIFFNMAGPCGGAPCPPPKLIQTAKKGPQVTVPGGNVQPVTGSGGRCMLKTWYNRGGHKDRLVVEGGGAWFKSVAMPDAFSGSHCTGEVPPLRHSTALFDYPRCVPQYADPPGTAVRDASAVFEGPLLLPARL